MEEPRVWERAMEEGRGEWVTVSVSSKLKARKKPAAPKARAEKSSAAKDKVKAAEAAAATAKVKAKAAAADVKAKAATKAAAPGAAAFADLLWVYTNDVYGTKEQVMVKIDHRNSYIKWLLDWDKKPRKPLPNFPEELRKATDAIKAERDEHERVLADFKRDGYAYVQVDIFNDDDPRANLPRDQYEVIPDDSDDEA